MANDYPANIPSYTETADIQKAFLMYHYGQDSVPDDNYEIQTGSMAGYIRDTILALQSAQNTLSVIPTLGSSVNLDDVISNAINLSTASPTTALGYPSTTRGILTTVTDTSDILTFQTYQTVQATNEFWWRSATLSGGTRTWSQWTRAAKFDHTHPELATNDSINLKIDSSITPNRLVTTDSSGKLVSSVITQTEVGYLAGLTRSVQDQLADKAALVHNHNDIYYTKDEQPRIFVQSGTPGNAEVGDLWFY